MVDTLRFVPQFVLDEAVKQNRKEGCCSTEDLRHSEASVAHFLNRFGLKTFIRTVQIPSQTDEGGFFCFYPGHKNSFPPEKS